MKKIDITSRKAILTIITIFSLCCNKAFGSDQISQLLEQAKISNNDKDYASGFDYAMEAYMLDKENPEAYLYMGIALEAMGKDKEAIEVLDKAIQYAGTDKKILGQANLTIAKSLSNLGNTKEALDAVNKGISYNDNDAYHYALRGWLLKDSQWDKAKKDLNKAYQMDPDNVDLCEYISYTYFDVGDYTTSLKLINHVIDLDKNNWYPYLLKGKIEEQMGNINNSANAYLTSIVKNDFMFENPLNMIAEFKNPNHRKIVLDEIDKMLETTPELRGIKSVLLFRWYEDNANDFYNQMIRSIDDKTSRYYRNANRIFPDNTARGVVVQEEKFSDSEDIVPNNFLDESKSNEIRVTEIAIGDEAMIREDGSENDDNKIFTVMEVPPEFPGGQSGLIQWLPNNIRYPEDAQNNHIQGRSLVKFVVNKDGSVSDAVIILPLDPALDAEAIRVVESMPDWIPGRNGGKPINAYFTLPVTYRLVE